MVANCSFQDNKPSNELNVIICTSHNNMCSLPPMSWILLFGFCIWYSHSLSNVLSFRCRSNIASCSRRCSCLGALPALSFASLHDLILVNCISSRLEQRHSYLPLLLLCNCSDGSFIVYLRHVVCSTELVVRGQHLSNTLSRNYFVVSKSAWRTPQ